MKTQSEAMQATRMSLGNKSITRKQGHHSAATALPGRHSIARQPLLGAKPC